MPKLNMLKMTEFENACKVKNVDEIRTERLILCRFRESDYDDLFEFLFQLKDDEFEGYPGITYAMVEGEAPSAGGNAKRRSGNSVMMDPSSITYGGGRSFFLTYV